MNLPIKQLLISGLVLTSFGAVADMDGNGGKYVYLKGSQTKKICAAVSKPGYPESFDAGYPPSAGNSLGGLKVVCNQLERVTLKLFPKSKLTASGQPAGLTAEWVKKYPFKAAGPTAIKLAASDCLKAYKKMGALPYETSEGGVVRSIGHWMTGASLTVIADNKRTTSAKRASCKLTIYKLAK